jgi:nucleoside-diphosphate-sugar epimerase
MKDGRSDRGRIEGGRTDQGNAESPRVVGVVGATSFVGRRLLPLATAAGWSVCAFSRKPSAVAGAKESAVLAEPLDAGRSATVEWAVLDGGEETLSGIVPCWVSLCPLWTLTERLGWLERHGVKRLVALSSTSRFTKIGSSDRAERDLAATLAAAERTLLAWADGHGVQTTILRPTLVYDGRHDRNVAAIAAFIRRCGWFPIHGRAAGLRQPVHVDDVAAACLAALTAESLRDSYELSGAETLSYRELLVRVFRSLGKRPRFVAVPAWAVRTAIPLLRRLPRLGDLSPAMFLRMNEDLVFDHVDAARDLGFRPRCFTLMPDDAASPGSRTEPHPQPSAIP